ncbi:MAG: AMP-binding protein, partial [Acidobacteria bacterium]|nr:AMP-binding protein [Acidobacteriota bacterium]
MPRETLADVFADLATIDAEFLVYDDGYRSWSHTYAEVGAASRAFAGRLARRGINKGDKVILWSENRPEWIVALWGCVLAGAVVVPIDYRSSSELVAKVRGITGSFLILAGEEVESDRRVEGVEVWSLLDLDWHERGKPPAVPISKDDIAEILFTSGATAEPKGVLLTHRNILANIVPIEGEVAKYRRYGRPFFPLRFLNLLPLSHMFGQAMATFIPPMLPGVTIFIRGYNPNEIIRQIKKRRISVLVSVPKILDVLREQVARTVSEAADPTADRLHIARRWWRYRRAHRLFGLKFWSFVVGAAPLDPALEEYWSRLGFLVIQGYGLTETAPIVSLNHPFAARKGSVGKAIAGLEVKIASDGEILVRGENVTSGYLGGTPEDQAAFDPEGWFHTGDIGEIDDQGQLYIRGRKKEMIVTPEGLNVFPDDVEKVLNQIPGVRESAVVGRADAGEERVHAVLALARGAPTPDDIVREANRQLADHQRIRSTSVWPGDALPRTEGTRKLKRREIKGWLAQGGHPPSKPHEGSGITALLARYAGNRQVSASTTLEDLGLSSLERVELMVAVEDSYQKNVDEAAFSQARTIGELQALLDRPASPEAGPREQLDFPAWNRKAIVTWIRTASLASWILPLARVFAHVRVLGLEHLEKLEGPAIFASNHQSHMDTPVILIALPLRRRYRMATAMAKEFFKAHFFPDEFSPRERFTNSLNYYLAAFFFNAFPLPQREAGARQTLQYIGELVSEGSSILIYPEGERAETGHIKPFRAGVGMIAAKLSVPVVPVRLDGVDRVLHPRWKMARPGRVRVTFGAPLHLRGADYARSARAVEEAVRALGPE